MIASIRASLAIALLAVPALAFAQSQSVYSNLANPAIGMNALFTGQAAHNLDAPYGLHFDEAELSLISVVDPYWTLNANIVFATDGVTPEEVWARNTSLPGVQLKLGMLRGSFGRHGLLHPHAFPFVEAPIVMANTIGEEGFKATGVEAAWLTPLPWYSELTGGVYEAKPAGADQPLDFGSSRHDNVPFLFHYKNQVDVTDATTMEIGQSWLQGRGVEGEPNGALGADLTFRNVPARNSNRRGWILQGEYIQRYATAAGDYIRGPDGGYASFQYRLSQLWWVGARADWARQSTADFLVDASGDPVTGDVSRATFNLAWAPSEFSFVRLEYSHANAHAPAAVASNDDRILLQLSYTIGYHPAHAY